jgi:hypothetical protein
MNNAPYTKLELALARLAILVGIVHGLGETVWEWFYDQSLPMLLVDYIAVALLLFAGRLFLRHANTAAAGLLAGAWGFTACLLYRVFFGRLDEVLAEGGTSLGEPDWFLVLLGAEFAVVAASFAAAMYLVHQRGKTA